MRPIACSVSPLDDLPCVVDVRLDDLTYQKIQSALDFSHYYATQLITISCIISTFRLINLPMTIKQLNLETYMPAVLLSTDVTSHFLRFNSNCTFELLAMACHRSFNMLNILLAIL